MINDNKIVLTGKILSIKVFNKKERIVTIISKNGKNNIFPRFKTNASLLKGFKARQRVKIEGHIENYYSDKAPDNLVLQRFVLDTIQKDKTMIEENFDIKGSFYETPYTKVLVAGDVLSIEGTDESEWKKVKIRTPKDVIVTIDANLKDPGMKNIISIGNNICSVLRIMTSEKKYKGVNKFFEDLVLQDAMVIK